MRRAIVSALLFVVLTACEGPTGPEGPAGPSGIAGRAERRGSFDPTGVALLALPPAAVENNRLPAIDCYISPNGETWLNVTTRVDDRAFCGFTGIGTAAPAVLLGNGIPGWQYYILAIW